MCYNKETSIITYILSMIFSLLLFVYGDIYDKNIAIFSLVFIQIQLAEYFMWLDQDCGKMNNYATIYAHIILMLQPVSIIVGALIYNTLILPKLYVYIFLIITLIPVMLVIITNIKNKKNLCSKEEKSGYLKWDFACYKWNSWDFIIYLIFLSMPWLFFKNKFKGILFLAIGFTSLLISKYRSKEKDFSFAEWESVWCILATVIPLVFLILIIFSKKKN